ncbi:MAG TPA: Holliday junction branch migration protein RuvA [Ruminococcaceae bacterium]|nr:Holliday junction branch migration protein RuvA [Oscillospiraceae bacterium]
MLYSLTGKLAHIEPSMAVVECGGVGFKCAVSATTVGALPEIGEKVTLYTYLQVRQDAMDLFGFYSKEELECFKHVTSVSGVGAKNALAVLSAFTPETLSSAIASGDAKVLTRAQGIGAKIAQRLVLELKDKMGALSISGVKASPSFGALSASGNAAEAVTALMSLGYLHSEASKAVGGLDASLPVQELIKQGLKQLSNKF